MNLAFPFHFNHLGRTGAARNGEYIRQLIEQVLFTTAGERVNRPDFGSGLVQMVFAPATPELAAALQGVIQAALQSQLEGIADVRSVEVTAEDESLTVQVAYVARHTTELAMVRFTQGGGRP